ncbi:MAG: CPBP family intramembrane glutamic endopeptidase [Pseudomonadota bacterium]
MRSDAFEEYLAPARAARGFWRPVLGLIIIMGLWVIGMIVVVMGWMLWRWAELGNLHGAVEALGQLGQGGGAEPVVIMLLSFAGIWAGAAVAAVVMHGQAFGTLFEPAKRILFSDFGKGVLLAAAFSGLSLLVAMLFIATPVRAQPMGDWLVLFVPLMALVFIQATGEELIFRGYLLQQLAIRFRSPIAWAILPSILFGLLHAGNTDGEAAYYYIAITGITGVTLAALVWRAGNLWIAVGLHWGVNMSSLTLVGADGIMAGTQLWLFPAETLMSLLQLNLLSAVALLVLVLSPAGRMLAAPRRPVFGSERAAE